MVFRRKEEEEDEARSKTGQQTNIWRNNMYEKETKLDSTQLISQYITSPYRAQQQHNMCVQKRRNMI